MLSDELTSASLKVSKEIISVSVRCTEMTADLLKKLIMHVITGTYESKLSRGEQSLKALNRQNKELVSVPITDTDIKNFRKHLRSYGLDFSIRKDPNNNNHLVYFKGQDIAQIKDILQNVVQNLLPEESKDKEVGQDQQKKSMKDRVTEAKSAGGLSEKKADLEKLDLPNIRTMGNKIEMNVKDNDIEYFKNQLNENGIYFSIVKDPKTKSSLVSFERKDISRLENIIKVYEKEKGVFNKFADLAKDKKTLIQEVGDTR